MAKDIKINKNKIVNIDGGVLTYENMIIQMSNISRVSIDTAPKINVFCKPFLDKIAKYFWTLLQVHFGQSCKALASLK